MQTNELTVKRATAMTLLQDSKMIDNLNAFAGFMSTGDLMTPQHFKGKPADCFMVAMQALQWGMNPISVASQAFPINGRLTYGAPLVIAIILQSGMVEPRPYFSAVGDWSDKGSLNGTRFSNEQGLGVRVGFKFNGDSNPTYSEVIYLSDQMVRNSPLWKSDPYQQLCYVGAKRWSSLYMPGATMGLHVDSDSTDLNTPEKDITPTMNETSTDIDFSDTVIDAEPQQIKPESDQVDIEELTSSPEDADRTIFEKANASKIESFEPKPGDLDAFGTPLDFEIHTGTKLKSNNSWRLNKKGREIQEANEQNQKETSENNVNEGPITDKYVVAIHKDSIEMIGSDALIVEWHNERDNTVKINGQEFPVSNEDGTYLAFCNEDGDIPENKQKNDNPFASK